MRQLLIFTAETSAIGPYDDDDYVQLYISPFLPKHLCHLLHDHPSSSSSSSSDENNSLMNNSTISNDVFIKYISDTFAFMALILSSKDDNSDIRRDMKLLFRQGGAVGGGSTSFPSSQSQSQLQLSQRQQPNSHSYSQPTTTKRNNSNSNNSSSNNIHGIVRMQDMIDLLLRIAQNEQYIFNDVAHEQGWNFPTTPLDHDFDLVRIMLLDSTCF